MNAGALLRETRLARRLDQAELARRSGTTQTYISRIERGRVSPSVKTLERLFHAMGMRLTLTTEPLSPGNVSREDLRADLTLTAAERVAQAMELSAFLTDVEASTSRLEPAGHGT